ncbi:MAG: cation transporter [Gammaproteobacteria bacterium]|nr:cation transporter [Gammaproteobacteria bacterium]
MRKSLTKLDGVSQAIVDLKAGTATVTYDPDKVELAQMTEATTNAGFPSTLRESTGGE